MSLRVINTHVSEFVRRGEMRGRDRESVAATK